MDDTPLDMDDEAVCARWKALCDLLIEDLLDWMCKYIPMQDGGQLSMMLSETEDLLRSDHHLRQRSLDSLDDPCWKWANQCFALAENLDLWQCQFHMNEWPVTRNTLDVVWVALRPVFDPDPPEGLEATED